jgi:hypothetical protein
LAFSGGYAKTKMQDREFLFEVRANDKNCVRVTGICNGCRWETQYDLGRQAVP